MTMHRGCRRPGMFWNCCSAFARLSTCIWMYHNAVIVILPAFAMTFECFVSALLSLYSGCCAVLTQCYRTYAQRKHWVSIFTIKKCEKPQRRCMRAGICTEFNMSRYFPSGYTCIYKHIKSFLFFFISKLTLCHNDFHSSEERQKMRRECKQEWHYRSDFTINEYDYLFAKTRELDVWGYSIRITSGIGLFICWACYRGHSHRCRSVFAVHVLCIADYVIIRYTPAIDCQCIRYVFAVQSHEWHANTQQQRYDWCHHVLRLDYNLLQMTVLTHWGRDKMARHFQAHFLRRISIHISLKFVPRSPIINTPTMVQVMAWRRLGDKPLFEPLMVRLSTHICVTRPQWDIM